VWFQNRRQRSGARPKVDSLQPTSEEDDAVTGLAVTGLAATLPPQLPNPFALEGSPTASMKMEAYTYPAAPFTVMWASQDWLNFCGFTNTEVISQSLRCIQGPETCVATLGELMEAISRGDSVAVTLTNYTKHGIPFRHTITVEPLLNSHKQVVLYKCASSDVAVLPIPHRPPSPAQPSVPELVAAVQASRASTTSAAVWACNGHAYGIQGAYEAGA